MLTIQPKLMTSKVAFKQYSQEDVEARRQELIAQKMELEELAKETPGFTKKALNAGALLLGGGAVAISAGYGTKLMIDGAKKFAKTSFAKNSKNYMGSIKKFVFDSYKSVKTKFLESDVYKKPASFVSKYYKKFAATKVGKYSIKAFDFAEKYAKKGYSYVKGAFNKVADKAKAVKASTYEKAAINTVGVSSGTCAVVNQIKEKQEA